MQIEYKKDLRHNYMVIKKVEDAAIEQYCSRLLERQRIDGILPIEQRYIDDKIFFYYDITAKQSMLALYEKSALSFLAVMQLFQGIMAVFDNAYEYLLPEDSFVLAPELIYLEFNGKKPSLCFLPGYSADMKKQMNSLLEYLMNKVDYNDKEAVLLVYQLYAASREEGFSVNQINEVLQNPVQPPTKEEQRISRHPKINFNLEESNDAAGFKVSENQAGKIDDIDKNQCNKQEGIISAPRMKERVEGEKEVSCYPIRNLVFTGICILGGILTIIFSISTGIIYNSFGNRIDYSKLLALVLIILCAEGYVVRKLLDKKCRVTKLIKTAEYIDPWSDSLSQSNSYPLKPQTLTQDVSKTETEDGFEEEEDNPTCILNAVAEQPTVLILKALDDKNDQDILITALPFHIGKHKKNVDYCLENNAVSRYHAKITKEGELYYITDLNSTNGTFLNSEPLMTYQKKEIGIGDEIAFANMKYIFTEK